MADYYGKRRRRRRAAGWLGRVEDGKKSFLESNDLPLPAGPGARMPSSVRMPILNGAHPAARPKAAEHLPDRGGPVSGPTGLTAPAGPGWCPLWFEKPRGFLICAAKARRAIQQRIPGRQGPPGIYKGFAWCEAWPAKPGGHHGGPVHSRSRAAQLAQPKIARGPAAEGDQKGR